MRTWAGFIQPPLSSMMARLPWMTTGTSGAPARVAMRNAPPLNSPRPPSAPL